MASHIHFIEFQTREGLMLLVRADEIASMLETVHAPKGKEPLTLIYLVLRNNNRMEIVGETRESVFHKLLECNGTVPVVVHMREIREAVEEAAT